MVMSYFYYKYYNKTSSFEIFNSNSGGKSKFGVFTKNVARRPTRSLDLDLRSFDMHNFYSKSINNVISSNL